MRSVEISCRLLAVPVRLRFAGARMLWSHHVLATVSASGAVGVGEGVLYDPRPHRAAAMLRSVVEPWARRASDPSAASVGPVAATAAELHSWSAVSSGLACAIDGALWDLHGRADGASVAELLGGALRTELAVTEQISLVDAGEAEAELARIRSRGTRRIKLKIGRGAARDLRTVERMRAAAGDEVELRVDANGAYRPGEATFELFRRLAELGVYAFEEPLARGQWPALRELRRRLDVPVILDESVSSLSDLERAIDAGAIDVLNVKLARLGGIGAARDYIEICRRRGVGVILGSSEELGLGTAQVMELAAALDHAPEVEALGPLRLGFDLVTPEWRIEQGALRLPPGPGLGVSLARNWRERLPSTTRVFDLGAPSLELWLFSRVSVLRQRLENARVRLLPGPLTGA